MRRRPRVRAAVLLVMAMVLLVLACREMTTAPYVLPLVITTTILPDGTVGEPYSFMLEATGGNGTYAWSLRSGALPDGLTLNPTTGEISGIPTTATPAVGGSLVRIAPRT